MCRDGARGLRCVGGLGERADARGYGVVCGGAEAGLRFWLVDGWEWEVWWTCVCEVEQVGADGYGDDGEVS